MKTNDQIIADALKQMYAMDDEMTKHYRSLGSEVALADREYARGKVNGVRNCITTLENLVKEAHFSQIV